MIFQTALRAPDDDDFDVVSPAIKAADGIVWNAPSLRAAAHCSAALNEVLDAFARCGSDQEVLRLAGQIYEACKNA